LPSVQEMDVTVCGGPTVQTPPPWATSAGGTSTVVRTHCVEMSTVTPGSTETLEIERTLLVGWELPSKGTLTVYDAPAAPLKWML